MVLAASKCALLRTGKGSPTCVIGSAPIPQTKFYSDLGVIFDDTSLFRVHVANLTQSVAKTANVIFRTLTSTNPRLYCQLYCSLVVPRLIYCSAVWTPPLIKDISLLQRSQRKFIERLARRCGVPITHPSISLPPITSLHIAQDTKALRSIISRGTIDNFFKITTTRTRAGTCLDPLEVSKSFLVSSQFPWRIFHQFQLGSLDFKDYKPLLDAFIRGT